MFAMVWEVRGGHMNITYSKNGGRGQILMQDSFL